MAPHLSRQNQFSGPFSRPQVNSFHYYPYHAGFPTMPLAQPNRQTAVLQHQPSSGLMLIQELAAAQRRLSEYTGLILNLYAELESIRNIVCHYCKERISPENLAQHPSAFASHFSSTPSTKSRDLSSQLAASVISQQTPDPIGLPFSSPDGPNCPCPPVNSPSTQLTTSRPASRTRSSTTLSHSRANTVSSDRPCPPVNSPSTQLTTSRPASRTRSSTTLSHSRANTVGSDRPRPPVNLPKPQLTISRAASQILTTPSHSRANTISSNVPAVSEPNEVSPPSLATPPTEPVKETAVTTQTIIESQWSVVYNSEIEQVLDITFVHAFKHTPKSVYAVRFSPDGNYLAAGLDYDLGRTQIYDVTAKSMTCALAEYPGYSYKKESPARGVWCICFSPDGRYLVVGSSFEMIYIWEIANKRVIAAFKGHVGAVPSLELSPDGRLLVSASFDCSVRIWKLRDGSSKPLSTEGGVFTSVGFSPTGCYVAASNIDRFLRIWNVRSGQLIGKWNGHEKRIWCVAFSPVGEELVSGSWGGAIKSWDVSSLKAPAPGSATKKCTVKGGVLVQKNKKNEKLKFDAHSGEVHSIAISSDGKWVITGSSDKRFRIWDMHTAVWHCTLDGHVDLPWAVDFSPIANYIATGSKDGFMTLWKCDTVQNNPKTERYADHIHSQGTISQLCVGQRNHCIIS